ARATLGPCSGSYDSEWDEEAQRRSVMTVFRKLSVVLLAGAMLAPLAAKADATHNDKIFCKAIGLSRSAASPRAQWAGSLYQPMVDANHKNGTPGSPYRDKPLFVSNAVTRDIERAARTVMMNPPNAYETGRIER